MYTHICIKEKNLHVHICNTVTVDIMKYFITFCMVKILCPV